MNLLPIMSRGYDLGFILKLPNPFEDTQIVKDMPYDPFNHQSQDFPSYLCYFMTQEPTNALLIL